jgi:hypothetical protein
MKRILILVAVLAIMVPAFAGPRLKVTIPFAFRAGNQLHPAGQYLFELGRVSCFAQTGSSLVIRSMNGSDVRVLLPMRATCQKNPTAASLVFNRYGKYYFLSHVRQGGYEVELVKSRAELETAYAFRPDEGVPSGVIQIASND